MDFSTALNIVKMGSTVFCPKTGKYLSPEHPSSIAPNELFEEWTVANPPAEEQNDYGCSQCEGNIPTEEDFEDLTFGPMHFLTAIKLLIYKMSSQIHDKAMHKNFIVTGRGEVATSSMSGTVTGFDVNLAEATSSEWYAIIPAERKQEVLEFMRTYQSSILQPKYPDQTPPIVHSLSTARTDMEDLIESSLEEISEDEPIEPVKPKKPNKKDKKKKKRKKD